MEGEAPAKLEEWGKTRRLAERLAPQGLALHNLIDSKRGLQYRVNSRRSGHFPRETPLSHGGYRCCPHCSWV